jgi:photosystem II stability/assembly factor-like uncharacterized protein
MLRRLLIKKAVRDRLGSLTVFLFMWLSLLAAPATAAEPVSLPAASVRQLLLDIAPAGARLVAVGERGRIFLSTDRGETWQPAAAPGEATLTAVHFHDDRHGWAVGHDAVILRTEDAGATWVLVHQAPAEYRPLLDLWFEDENHGFAVGAYGLCLETRDGGRRWQRRTLLPEDMHLNAIAGGPDGRLYVAGEAGTLLRSDDGGRRWRKLASPYRGSFFGVLRLPDGNPLVFGLRGKAFRSPDGGKRWLPVDTHGEAALQGGAVLADRSVVLVGNDGTVLVSRDGGRRFAPRHQGLRQAFAAVTASGASLVLVGEHGVTLSPRMPPEAPR